MSSILLTFHSSQKHVSSLFSSFSVNWHNCKLRFLPQLKENSISVHAFCGFVHHLFPSMFLRVRFLTARHARALLSFALCGRKKKLNDCFAAASHQGIIEFARSRNVPFSREYALRTAFLLLPARKFFRCLFCQGYTGNKKRKRINEEATTIPEWFSSSVKCPELLRNLEREENVNSWQIAREEEEGK